MNSRMAEALARVMAGESAAAVGRDMGIPSTNIRQAKLLANAKRTVITSPTAAQRLQDRLAVCLEAMLETLTTHVRYYGSDDWRTKATASEYMESSRTVGSRFTAIMDRIGGRTADAGDTDS